MVKATVFDTGICWFESSYFCLQLMNSLFLSFIEVSLGTYISAAILFSVILSNFSFYSYPRLLSALSTFSIFVLGSMLFLLLSLEDPCYNTFFGLLSFSPFSSFFEILLLFFGCFVLILNRSYYSKRGLFQYEYDLLLSFSFLGLVMLCLSNDLLVVYMAIELQSLAFYVLATFRRNSEFSNEAGLKYFILGSFSSCFLLFGFSLIYLSLGSTSFDTLMKLSETGGALDLAPLGLVLSVVALLFKLGAVPFHMWLCDVYEGALISVTAFFAIIPKAVIFCLLFKIFFVVFSSYGSFWSFWFTITGFSSVALASVVALYQKRTKRLLAYSAISHVGFILLGISSGTIDSIKAAIIYLVIYMIMNIGIFSLIMSFSSNGLLLKYLINWSFLKKWNVVLAMTFAILLFSVAGVPPLAGFYSKFGIILTLVTQENIALALLVIIFSCIACFYYIRLIKILFFGESKNYVLINKTSSKGLEFCLALSTMSVCFFLLKPNFLINISYYVALCLI